MSELSAFQAEVTEWAERTFPGSTPEAKWAHLDEEVQELGDCIILKGQDAPEEAADCLLILLHIAGAAGFDLLDAARAKHARNLARKWGAPDSRGVVRHIEEAVP